MGSPAIRRDSTLVCTRRSRPYAVARSDEQAIDGGLNYSTELLLPSNDCCDDAAHVYAIMSQTGEALQTLYPALSGDEPDELNVNVNQKIRFISLPALHKVSSKLDYGDGS